MFYAKPSGSEDWRFFVWDLGVEKLMVYEQNEPYPNEILWLSNERLLCIKKGVHWIANLYESKIESLDYIEDYFVANIAPDGKRLVLWKGPGIGGSIYVGDIEQQHVQEIVRGEEYEKSHAILYPLSWSPDGHWIACVGGYEDEIWLVGRDGSNPHKAATSDYFWKDFQWSPDGRSIAYTRSLDEGGPYAEVGGVFIMDLKSMEEKRALTLRRSEKWVWSPDGSGMFVSKLDRDHFSLRRLEIQTGGVTEVMSANQAIKNLDMLIAI